MKNNKFLKINVIKIIDNLYKLSGKDEIPDVKKICSEAKVDRQTAIKFLCTWWEKHYAQYSKKDAPVTLITQSFLPPEVNEEALLVKACASVQCLSKEVLLYNEILNNSAPSSTPLGNYILNSLQEIENHLFIDKDIIKESQERQRLLQEELKKSLEENNNLSARYLLLEKNTAKELHELQEKLDASRREALAATQRLKSLKRDRRKLSINEYFSELSLT